MTFPEQEAPAFTPGRLHSNQRFVTDHSKERT